MRERDLILDALCEVARPIILERFDVSSCIASTRIVIDVLDYFGIRAKPLPCKVGVYNAKAWEAVQSNTDPDWEGGAWGVGIGFGSEDAFLHQAAGGKGIDGHLIALVEADAIVDMSIDQTSRPHKDIVLHPFWSPIQSHNRPGFLESDQGLVMTSGRTGTRVVYWRFPELDYQRSPDWTDRSRRKDLVGRIIRQVREEISHSKVS